jgi:energy-coupling factor transporter transmembrane protein EcfT
MRLEPRTQLAILCLLSAFVFWNNDILFFAFAIMGAVTRLAEV